ncbi:dipeptide ABC transporter ATP-binding protein [Paenisporosarcina indica]|uniref:ABC transporter ATP-binding protein n=1 Tax=Paenisporosarcina indica TaxID=650093 RepID=UPI00094F62E9|nr:ABC transporter ATP-binding protein [Paenisporosarcina indica]
MEPLLEVKDLYVSFHTQAGVVKAVRGVNFTVNKGETLAIVGESGSGKSVTSKAIMQLLPDHSASYDSGKILFDGQNILEISDKKMESIRGSDIAMVFQDPMTALNPTMTIGKQVAESVMRHEKISKKAALQRAIEILDLVGIPEPATRVNQYPHQFSGGMRQRVVIAIAIACNPRLLIADEPTTALDVTIQAQILDLLKEIQRKTGTSIILITHDLGVVANMADKVAVMYAGKIVEEGTVEEVFEQSEHPYTWGLLKSIPNLEANEQLYSIPGTPPDLLSPPVGDAFAARNEFAMAIDYEVQPPMFAVSKTHTAATWLLHEKAPDLSTVIQSTERELERTKRRDRKDFAKTDSIIQVHKLKKHFHMSGNSYLKAVDGVSFDIRKGETLGLVGESGCGKSTTGRTIMRLYEPTGGEVYFNGKPIHGDLKKQDENRIRQKMQMIFQDPYASLDPRKKVIDSVAEGIDIHKLAASVKDRRDIVQNLLEIVGLNKGFMNRYPHEFSGGQRQRIGIARALAVNPDVIIADEPISALDVSIQAQVVNLLKDLQHEQDLTYLFIAHDISMVKYISDRIGVMYLGNLVELAPTDELSKEPLHPYTQALLSAVPTPNPKIERGRERIILTGDLPNPMNPPTGCRFRTRCPYAMEKCKETPIWKEAKPNHFVACHLIE